MNLQMMDLAKLKVVELRAELTQRGLDAKGNKPVLVERLRKALEEESGDPKPAAEASVQDTNEENVGKAAQKEVRERTPEPMPPKTPGRSSRSSATPSKTAAQRGNPKVLLAPLTEKQMTPTKSPPSEKMDKTPEKQEQTSPAKQEKASPEKPQMASPEKQQMASPEKQETTSPEKQEIMTPENQEKSSSEQKEESLNNEAPPDEAADEEKSEDAVQTQKEEAPEHLETGEEAVKTDTEAAPASDVEKSEEPVANAIPEETEPKSEESVGETEKPTLDDEKVVQEDDKEEESSAVAADVSEESSVEAKNTAEEDVAEEMEKEIVEEAATAETAEEQTEAPDTDDEDKLLEDDAMETNDNIEDNKETVEPMEVKPEVDDDSHNATEAAENTEECATEETQEEKSKVEVKEEVDDKSNVENALAKNEEQDVEMKEEVKEEQQEDSEQDSKDRDRRDRKDRKRKRSTSPQEDSRHKSPQPSYKDDEPDLKESEVVLSWYDSDLNLVINRESFLSATAMHSDGFGYIWAGARASFGFTEGKIYFEAKITELCDVDLQDEAAPHVLRVGWSVLGTTMQLGEEPLTYGYGGTGKISTGNRFSDYGVTFGKDDIVGCYLDFSADGNVVISYTINGQDQGPAFTVSKSVLEGKALFPHILTKNCTVECNFGQEKSWSEEILEGYVPAGTVDLKDRIAGPRRPEKREECEMIMMCGLPAAGKTVWATKYAVDHPEKMYNVLGTNALIEKMKVIGLPRKRNYHGRWEVLINKCTRCLNKLLDLAATRRRNYILDQTNVYPSAQRRKMRSFYGYKRRAVVIVPTDEEFKSRTVKRTACEGEVAPESAVLEMKANFGAPVVGESFDVVEWVELPEEEAKLLIAKYNKEGKEAGYGLQQPSSKRPRFERSSDNHRESRDSRQSSRDSRDSRDHRDRRNNYPDRSRNSTWRGGSSGSGGGGGNGWRDRQQRPAGGHVRHGGGGSGGYGGPSGGGGGWRGRAVTGGVPSPYRPANDRRVAVHDRRTSGSDRNRSAPTRQGGWGPMNSYQSSQQSSGWGGSQSGNWPSSQSQQQGSWGGQQAWSQPQHQQQQQQQQQQWGNWKGYGQSAYAQQSSYSQQGYGNGNWGSWNQQYYNQYWGQQQPTGQTSAAGSQAVSVTGSTTTGNSTANTGSTYSSYSPAWQGYAQSQSYSFPAESSNTNAQQQK